MSLKRPTNPTTGTDPDGYYGTDLLSLIDYVELPSPYKFFVYLDTADNKFKAKSGKDNRIVHVSTDNTNAQPVIQGALDDSTNAPGIVQLAANTLFPLTTFQGGSGSSQRCLRVFSGQWLKGGGWSTVIKGPGVYTPIHVFDVADVRLSDFCVDGQNTDGINGGTANTEAGNIRVSGTGIGSNQRVVVDNIKAMNGIRHGIGIENTDQAIVRNCYCERSYVDPVSGLGMACISINANARYVSIIGNHIRNAGGPSVECVGLGAQGNTYVAIIGNIAEARDPSGLAHSQLTTGGRNQILVESNSTGPRDERVVIANNIVHANYHCIYLAHLNYATVHDNILSMAGYTTTIDDDRYAAILTTGSTTSDIDIHDNIIVDSALAGISCQQNAGRLSIHHNKIINPANKPGVTGTQASGIHLSVVSPNTMNFVEITDNEIIDTRGVSATLQAGLRISKDTNGVIDNLIIERNVISGQTGTAIVFVGTGHKFRRRKARTSVNGAVSTVVNIPHGLSAAPNIESVMVTAHSLNARGEFAVTAVDSTNITLTYSANRVSGTNNLTYVWEASID